MHGKWTEKVKEHPQDESGQAPARTHSAVVLSFRQLKFSESLLCGPVLWRTTYFCEAFTIQLRILWPFLLLLKTWQPQQKSEN